MRGLMNRTYTVLRRRRTPDGQGGFQAAYEPVFSLPGRLSAGPGRPHLRAQAVLAEVSHTFYAVGTPDVRRGDRIEGGGVTVEVLAVRDPSRAGHHLECDCREVQTDGS